VATDSEEVEIVATPPALSVPVPRGVAPSKKLTVPVGVPAGLVTVAAMVTGAPNVEGFGEAATAVELVALLTACETAEETEPLKLGSPP
jgi:hypothetical protein